MVNKIWKGMEGDRALLQMTDRNFSLAILRKATVYEISALFLHIGRIESLKGIFWPLS